MINKKELMNEIVSLQKILERYYLNLGKEMNSWLDCVAVCSLNNQEIDKLVDVITTDDSEECGKRQKFISNLDEQIIDIRNEYKKSIQKNQHLTDALRSFQELAEELGSLSLDLIAKVVKDGEEVGVVSFLERMRQNSASCVGLAAQSLNQSEKNNSFLYEQNQLAAMIHKGDRHWTSLEKRLKNARHQLYQQSDLFNQFFASLTEDGQIMKSPILEVLQVIQNQDLFRQSLDHVLLLLDDDFFAENHRTDSSDKGLDRLVFSEAVCLFSESLFNELSERLRNDLDVIQTRMNLLQKYLKGLEGRVNLFFIEEKGDKPLSPGLLNAFREQSEVETAFTGLLKQQSLYLKKLCQEQKKADLMSHLDTTLQAMQEKVNQFTPLIRLGSKIARNYPMLKSDNSFLNQSRVILEKMQRRIQRVYRFKDELNTVMYDHLADELGKLPQLDKVYLNNRNFKEISNQLFQSLAKRQSQMCLSFNNCFITVKETRNVTDFLKDESAHFRNLLKIFTDIRHVFLAEKEKLFQTRNINEWTIKEKRIAEKLMKFTIHRQKKSFSDFAGYKEEHTAFKEGSVIMF